MRTERICIPAVKDGETFTIAGMEFIKFPEVNGEVPVLMKDVAFRSKFGDNNDLRASGILKRMKQDILPKIIEAIGEESICSFETDLTTLCGLKNYGVMESKISLHTLDFQRENVQILDKYKPDCYCWLATPESAKPHDNPYWVVGVAPSGFIYGGDCCYDFDRGVRPFLHLKSYIFESFEE